MAAFVHHTTHYFSFSSAVCINKVFFKKKSVYEPTLLINFTLLLGQ